jgi:hypothetical protein
MVQKLVLSGSRRRRLMHFSAWAGFCLCAIMALAQDGPRQSPFQSMTVKVRDSANQPIAGAQITVNAHSAVVASSETNPEGNATLSFPVAANVEISVKKEGLEPISRKIALDSLTTDIEITMIPRIEARETVSVQSGDSPSASTVETLAHDSIKEMTNRPANVADALALTPGVLRTPDGIAIAGGDEKHNALIVNSVDSTDPATGQFGLLVPVDSVETLSVAATPFQAQYGNFTAGVVSADTRRGGEKWNFALNDPFPEFRIRSGHLQGLRSATPNVSFGGPVIDQKLYFHQTGQLFLQKNPVLTLPFPFNESRTLIGNFFSQADYVFSPEHTLTGTLQINPQDTTFANLDFFNPQPVTPNVNGMATAVAFTDRLSVAGGILQSTLARQAFEVDVAPQGLSSMVLTPAGNTGNYFGSHDRQSGRIVWGENFSPNAQQFLGAHNFQFGTSATFTVDHGTFNARDVNIESTSGTLLKRIQFVGGDKFSKSDFEFAAFVQDHWTLNARLAFDAGVRMDRQNITDTVRFAPRTGFALTPFKNKSTIIRGGAGVFFDHVPLNVYAFEHYPQQLVTTYDTNGNLLDGPRLFQNLIDITGSRLWLVRRNKPTTRPGDFAPYSVATALELEQRASRLVLLQFKFSYRASHGLITVAPKHFADGGDALLMRDSGSSQYRDFQFTARIAEDRKSKLFVSYVHSKALGSVDALSTYLGDVSFPIVRRRFYTNLAIDTPDRILVWGETPLKWKMKIAPMVEYRTGLPYSQVDAYQNFVGLPNSNRFPSYFSLDTQLIKDVQINPKYAGRFTIRGLNLSNHFNALAVHPNIADPQFGNFFGSYGRRFRLDFDVLF